MNNLVDCINFSAKICMYEGWLRVIEFGLPLFVTVILACCGFNEWKRQTKGNHIFFIKSALYERLGQVSYSLNTLESLTKDYLDTKILKDRSIIFSKIYKHVTEYLDRTVGDLRLKRYEKNIWMIEESEKIDQIEKVIISIWDRAIVINNELVNIAIEQFNWDKTVLDKIIIDDDKMFHIFSKMDQSMLTGLISEIKNIAQDNKSFIDGTILELSTKLFKYDIENK
jgi:hypothetical protein